MGRSRFKKTLAFLVLVGAGALSRRALPAAGAVPAEELRPVQVAWLGPGEGLVLARQGQLAEDNRVFTGNLPAGAWLVVRCGIFSQPCFHALRWAGQPRLYLKQSGPLLLLAAAEEGPWAVAGIDARSPEGRAALDRHTPGECALSVTAGGLDEEGLLEALVKARPAALWLDFAGGLQGLSRLGFLQRLSLARCEGLNDLRPLEPLARLTSLFLWDCRNLKDVSALSGLPLAELDLGGCGDVTDVSPVCGLIRLRALGLLARVPESQAHHLRAAGIPAPLLPLNLNGPDKLRDVTPVAAVTRLARLDLYLTNLTTVRALRELGFLRALDLSGCSSLKDISDLAVLANLESLSLSACSGLTEIEALRRLPGLKALNLSGCTALADFAPLAGLTRLESLNLSGCPTLSDAAVLGSLGNLRTLNLSGCVALSNLQPLELLRRLDSLVLSRCTELVELKPLRKLRALSRLDLAGCVGVVSFRPLRDLRQLRTLDLSGCPQIRAEELKDLRKRLPLCRIMGP